MLAWLPCGVDAAHDLAALKPLIAEKARLVFFETMTRDEFLRTSPYSTSPASGELFRGSLVSGKNLGNRLRLSRSRFHVAREGA
jgi:hypothetical protein